MTDLTIVFKLLRAGARLPDKYNHQLRGWRLKVVYATQVLYFLCIIALLVWAVSLFI